MEKIKKYIDCFLTEWAVPVVFSLAVTGLICFGYEWYTSSRTEHEYQHVNKSVADVEAGIDRAGKRLDSAQTEIKNAEKHIQRADEATGKLAERTKRNAEELDECQHIADRMSERSERIQSIIADVEKANQGNGAQAESHA